MPPGLKLTDEESPLRWPLYVPAGQSRKSLHPADITTRLVSPQLRVAAARVKGLHCNTSLTACHQLLPLSLRYNLPQFNWIAGFSSANSYVPETEMRRARPGLSPHRASRAGVAPASSIHTLVRGCALESQSLHGRFIKPCIDLRRNRMPILKSPPRPPKNETLQIRIEEDIRSKLAKYAEFIDASEAYVVSEALKILFRKDDEFKSWLGQHPTNSALRNETILELNSKGGLAPTGTK